MKNYALRQGIDYFRSGKRKEAEAVFDALTVEEPRNETAWLWLAATRDTDAEKVKCVQSVLAINPNNQKAVDILRRLSLESPPARMIEKTPLTEALAEPADALEDNEPYERLYHRVVDTVLADDVERDLDLEVVQKTGAAQTKPAIKPVPQPAQIEAPRRRFTSPFQTTAAAQPHKTAAAVEPASQPRTAYPAQAAAVEERPRQVNKLSNWLTLALLVVLVLGQIWSVLRINQLEDRLKTTAEQLNAVQMELIVVNQLLDRD